MSEKPDEEGFKEGEDNSWKMWVNKVHFKQSATSPTERLLFRTKTNHLCSH